MDRKRDVIAKISDAMWSLHRNGIYHRDIKPQNVIMSSTEDDALPMLTDFEFSKNLADVSHVTMQVVVGTQGYIAPEVARVMDPAESLDPIASMAADVFALAATYVVVVHFDGDIRKMPRSQMSGFDALGGLRACNVNDNDPHFRVMERALDPENPASRPCSKDLRDELCLTRRKCCLAVECGGEPCSLLDGIVCAEGTHFICSRDVDAYVSGICAEGGSLEQHNGEVKCPFYPRECTDKPIPFARIYDKGLSPQTLDGFIAARLRIQERTLSETMEKEKKEAIERALAMTLLERKILEVRRELEEIMTNKCPKCKSAWHDFEGCCALYCRTPGCDARFCGICNAGPFPDAHPHVRECRWKTIKPGNVYSTVNELEVMWANRRRAQVAQRFAEGELVTNQELRSKVLSDPTVRGFLRDLGLVIH